MQVRSTELMSGFEPNATLLKFGYPRNLVHEGRHWAVLVRPAQPTLGSLVLCALGEETAYGALSADAFVEQSSLVAQIERTLRCFNEYERINHLMLMMVDPHVHFHVLPRYAETRTFEGVDYPDKGWPGLPDLASSQPATDALVGALRDTWRLAADQEGRS